jgi:hypothetical protein
MLIPLYSKKIPLVPTRVIIPTYSNHCQKSVASDRSNQMKIHNKKQAFFLQIMYFVFV